MSRRSLSVPAATQPAPITSGRCQKGISLIEVIVALVIVSSFGAALFTWAAQTYRTANRAAELMEQMEIERNIIELGHSLNPALRPEGKLETDSYIYEWRSTPTRPPVDHVKHPAGLSPYQVSMYRVSTRVLRRDGGAVVLEQERQLAGFVQARVRPSGPPGFSTPTP